MFSVETVANGAVFFPLALACNFRSRGNWKKNSLRVFEPGENNVLMHSYSAEKARGENPSCANRSRRSCLGCYTTGVGVARRPLIVRSARRERRVAGKNGTRDRCATFGAVYSHCGTGHAVVSSCPLSRIFLSLLALCVAVCVCVCVLISVFHSSSSHSHFPSLPPHKELFLKDEILIGLNFREETQNLMRRFYEIILSTKEDFMGEKKIIKVEMLVQ